MSDTSFTYDEFLAAGSTESTSPFLTRKSRHLGKNLSLKTSILSALFLAGSFAASFFYPDISNLLLLGVYFLSGTPALIDSLEDLKEKQINIDVLMTLAALLSVVIGSAMEGGLLLVLFDLSSSMEHAVTHKTKGALVSLNKLSPRIARAITEDGHLIERSTREIKVGTHILVRSGEIIPLDGIVVEGSSFINLFHLTGESHPISTKIGDEVAAGARNIDGSLTLEVTRRSDDSTLSRMIHLITHAQEAKPKLEKFFDRFGKRYALSIIAISFLFSAFLPLFISCPFLGIEGSLYRALTFLIAASPCALIIATPTAYLSAISSCARKGILLKGGVTLDALNSAKIIAFDKTGTLTTGKLRCTSITSHQENIFTQNEILGAAASIERHAVHPIANAILSYAKEQNAPLFSVEDSKATPGQGIEGIVTINNQKIPICIGQAEYLSRKTSITLPAEGLNAHLLLGSELFTFHFEDEIRPNARSLIERLKQENRWRIVMLTGDSFANASVVAKELGIDEVYANLRPENKLAKVEELSSNGGLIMVGDGVNDAPSLARATVGISMGKIGSEAAVEASDIVFLKDDISLLDWLGKKSRKTRSLIKQNLILSLAVIVFASLPALFGIVPLWAAVILHEGGTLLVGLNSLRLLRS